MVQSLTKIKNIKVYDYFSNSEKYLTKEQVKEVINLLQQYYSDTPLQRAINNNDEELITQILQHRHNMSSHLQYTQELYIRVKDFMKSFDNPKEDTGEVKYIDIYYNSREKLKITCTVAVNNYWQFNRNTYKVLSFT